MDKGKEDQVFETYTLPDDLVFSADSLLPGIKGALISSDGKPLISISHPSPDDDEPYVDLTEDLVLKAIEAVLH